MGGEESTRREPPFFNAQVVPPRYSRTSQSHQRSSRPSVSEFSNNPERYPGFVLALVLATGKMEVMTRQEAHTKATQIKIVSGSSQSDRSDNSGFFRQSSSDDENMVLQYLRQGSSNDSLLYFDVTSGRIGICNRADWHRYQGDGMILLG